MAIKRNLSKYFYFHLRILLTTVIVTGIVILRELEPLHSLFNRKNINYNFMKLKFNMILRSKNVDYEQWFSTSLLQR